MVLSIKRCDNLYSEKLFIDISILIEFRGEKDVLDPRRAFIIYKYVDKLVKRKIDSPPT
jgi:hypothetical protein